jgi:hypothetical protein
LLRLTPSRAFAQNAAMRDRQGSHRWGPAAAVALVLIVPLLYPLSLGPVVLLYDSLGQPQWMERLEPIYAPLMDLPEPLESLLDRYVDLWDQ